MILDITIQADSDDANDLAALTALIAALGGRTAAPTLAVVQPIRRPDDDDVDHSDEDAEVVGAAVAAGAPAKDSAGIAWDERIHSASRATIADGTWRRRKNTPDATYDAVMAELRRPTEPAPAAVEQTSATPAPSTDDTPPPPTDTADTAPVADDATNAADVPPPPADGLDLSTFPKFVQAVNGKDVPADRKTYGALNELCASFGVAAFKDMKDKQSDWAMFYDMVG